MAKPAPKRVKVEKGADSEPAPTGQPVKEEKKPARPKTAAEVAHEREVEARTAPYKGRALFGRQLDINAVLGGNQRTAYFTINAANYSRRGGQECIGASVVRRGSAAHRAWTVPLRLPTDGTVTPLFVRRGGYPAELRNERYGPYNGTAPGRGGRQDHERMGVLRGVRMEEDEWTSVDGIRLSSMPEGAATRLDWARTAAIWSKLQE